MKRFRAVLAILLLMTVFAAMTPVTASADTKMKVTTNNLRLRNGPGLDYTVKGRYKIGTVVTVLSSKTSRHWYYVKTRDGKTGWMYKTYLKKTTTGVVAAKETASGTAIAQKNVYMRKGPSTSYDRILTVRNGKTMRIIGKSGSWYKVRYNGKTGFVYSGIVKVVK